MHLRGFAAMLNCRLAPVVAVSQQAGRAPHATLEWRSFFPLRTASRVYEQYDSRARAQTAVTCPGTCRNRRSVRRYRHQPAVRVERGLSKSHGIELSEASILG